MGSKSTQTTGLANALFSKVRQRVLALIFGHPERSFYTSEILRNVNSGTGAVERELSRLRLCGLVTVEQIGNQKHYRANRNSPIFGELQGLILKTVGLAEPLKEALEPFRDAGIETAFVFGSVAKGTDTAQSDIDLMVVGSEIEYSRLHTRLQSAEHVLLRKINPVFISSASWRRKTFQKGSFVNKISALPKIFIVGSEDDLRG